MDIRQIKSALEKSGKSRKGLAEHMGWWPSTVTSLLDGERHIKANEIPKIREYLELDDSVPIVGVLRAGGEVFYSQESNLGRAKPVDGSGPNTVAIEIQATSLGADFDGWLAYYNEAHNPVSPSLLGQLCVAQLPDGRIVMKKIRRSRLKNRYHLTSANSDPILDTAVEWAARVIDIRPKDLASK